jgi:putative DNA primase/helicase
VPSIVLIDNVRDQLDAAPLAAALTARVWQDRVLGATRIVRLPVRCTWLATGNNVATSVEIARRTVASRIDSSQEHPWERSGFRHDPLIGWAQANRGNLCWAILTLARAWIAAGRPEPGTRLGSFESWSHVVGGILSVAGVEGFLGNRSAVYAQADADGEGWRTFITIWWEQFKGNRVGVDELFALAKSERLLTELRGGRSDHGARTALGMSLSTMRDRRIGQYWLRDLGRGHGGGAMYRLEQHPEIREGQCEKGSPGSPGSPSLGVGPGEPGEPGEPFFEQDSPRAQFENEPSPPACTVCALPVGHGDQVFTTNGGVRHADCAVSTQSEFDNIPPIAKHEH